MRRRRTDDRLDSEHVPIHLSYFSSLSESTRKLILDRYVSRYEAHVTPSMVASVPSHGNEHMASEIMAVGPIQVINKWK